MEDLWKTWTEKLHFRDVLGNKLYVGDVVLRCGYSSNLSLSVISGMSTNGYLKLISYEICLNPWHKRDEHLYDCTYTYDDNVEKNYKIFINHGLLQRYNSAKLIKIQEQALTPKQKDLVKVLKSKI